jgi:transcriptional regulator with XRE-family HTH domain
MSLGTTVKWLREQLGMNQKQLAQRSGIAQATISRIESEQVKELKSEALIRLAKALGVTVDFLVGKTDRLTYEDVVRADPIAQEILRGYMRLSSHGREMLKTFVHFLETLNP